MGVFEHFREHPRDRPYRRCPSCGSELRMFRHSRRPGEIAFYCPGCDRNASVTDVDEARSVPSDGPLRYLDGDSLVTLGGRFGLVENTADLYALSHRPHAPLPVRLCLVSCRPPGAGAEGARDPARRKGESESAADRLFRGSFDGVALNGGGRARKKPEKHRDPCGESGARHRLRARGITGIRRIRLCTTSNVSD